MITRVLLENWRAYDRLDLELRRGTTFVVARNGIGKTSLIEGATWALYGDAGGRPVDAVRLGSKAASARVDVRLPDGQMLSVTRELPRRLAKTRPAPVSGTLDGRVLSEAELDSTIRDAFQADLGFLARVTMLRRHDLDRDASQLNLQQHLCRFFGIDALQETLDQLRARRRQIEAQVRNIKQTVGVSPKQLKELRSQHEAAMHSAEEAKAAQQDAQQVADAAAQAVREAEAYASWQQREKERIDAIESLATEIASMTGSLVDADELTVALDRLEAEATSQLDEIRRHRGFLEGRITAVENALAQLTEEAGVCPVCRRPLSPEDAAHARTGHDEELREMRAELSRLDESASLDRLEFVRGAQRRVSRLSPGVVQPPEAGAIEEAKARHFAAQALLEEARELVVQRRALAMTAAAAVERAESDLRANELLRAQFKALGLVVVAIDALEATIGKVLDGTIDPLARQVAGRWKRLFGNRGPLQVTGQGSLSRELQGESLSFSAFSTGEKMGAQLLLRLMILNAATRASFCWVDEPLEHLDPDARRQVASMLAVTPATTAVEQVLVTTYEEPLARRLANRMAADVDLVYVRAGDTNGTG